MPLRACGSHGEQEGNPPSCSIAKSRAEVLCDLWLLNRYGIFYIIPVNFYILSHCISIDLI